MKSMTHRALTAAAPGAGMLSRSRPLAALLAALALGLAGQLPDPAGADAAGQAADLRVGHTVRHIVVPGSAAGEDREVDVHLWYPADQQGLTDRPKTVYQSALWGRPLPAPLVPLSWKVEAEIAREDAPIDPHGQALPVIVFSHGSTNDPIDYAHTLELIAGAGFVVAAPYHVNNTQDDVRIDFINQEAAKYNDPTWTPIACNDHRPPPCSRTNVAFSMKDRVNDISSILNELPEWFGDRVDVTRTGVLGHSRGTVTALAAAGGSVAWGIPEAGETLDSRVKAIMGMAIGASAITNMVNLTDVIVPTVLVAGGKDTNSAQLVSEEAFKTIKSADKLFVGIPNATHRSFDSSYCAQLQSAGAAFDVDHDGVVEQAEVANPGPVLDRHTVALIAASPPMFLSGKAVYYCAGRFFTSPVDIRRVVAATPNAEYACDATSCAIVPPVPGAPASKCVTTSIPCTGLETEEVKQGMTQIAVAFFDSALKRTGNDGIHFTGYLAPKWLMEHVPMVGSAQAYAGPGSVCPPDQGVICSE